MDLDNTLSSGFRVNVDDADVESLSTDSSSFEDERLLALEESTAAATSSGVVVCWHIQAFVAVVEAMK